MLEPPNLAGIEDPFAFTPENNFGARGPARLLATIPDGAQRGELGQEAVYRYARSLAERLAVGSLGPNRIVDLGPGALLHLTTAFDGYPAELIRIGPRYLTGTSREAGLGKHFGETDLEDYGDLARLEEAQAPEAPTLFILAGILERLVDPRPVLRFLRRALRRHPSNRLVLSTPDRIGIDGACVPDDPARFRTWALDELGLALRGAGFEVCAIGHVPHENREISEQTILVELRCDEESYRAFLIRNGLPTPSDHLVLTTEHADAPSALGIGTYHGSVARVLESPRLLLFAGAGGLPEGWCSFVGQRGWLHVAECCGADAGLSEIAAVDAQEALRAVLHLVFLYDDIRLIEYQDHLGIGHRIAQAKRARLLPPTVTVLCYAHGTHFYLDHARGAFSHERDVEVDARERLSLELADCVWFPSGSSERLYIEQQGLSLRRHEVRPCPKATDPESVCAYREGLALLKQGNAPPAPPRGPVSVVVPNLNGEARFFRDLRLGLENSSYPPAKVLFVDDGSDERGLETVEQAAAGFKSLACTVVRNAHNLGLAGARNAGLAQVATPYVCVHDNDDIILNRYLDLACRILDENPEVVAVTSWYLPWVDGKTDWNSYTAGRRAVRPLGADLGLGLRSNVFGGALSVFRTAALRRIGGWDASSKALWEDWQLFLRLAALGEPVWVIPQALWVYRIRHDSMARTYAHFPGQLRLARALEPLPLAQAISLLRAMHSPPAPLAAQLSRLELDRARLTDKLGRLQSELARLRRVAGSPFWRASYPLRYLLGWLPAAARRRGRARLKALWLFVTQRIMRIAPGAPGTPISARVAARQNPPPGPDPGTPRTFNARKKPPTHPNTFMLDLAGPTPQVFVAGMARSGTTWVTDLINHDGRHRILFEPFFPKRVKEANDFEYLQYLPPGSDHAALSAAAKTILSGSLRNPWADRDNQRWFYFRRMIKDIRCNLMLKWLSDLAPRMRVVLVIRNPFSVATSWLRLGWGTVPGSERTDIAMLLDQPALCAAYPSIEEAYARMDVDDPFQRLILEWAILHHVPFQQFSAGGLYVLHYENLLLDFEAESARLFTFLDAPSPNVTLHSGNHHGQKSSRTNWLKRDFSGDTRALVSEWKSTFSTEQVKKANEILSAFSLQHIYDGDGLPTIGLSPHKI